jgi:hypothetical protein
MPLEDIVFPKKRAKKKEAPKQRIMVCGTQSWSKPALIKKTLKSFEPKTIQCVVIVGLGSRGTEQQTAMVCKELKIPYFAAWYDDKFIAADMVMRIFKPNMVVAFNEDPKANTYTDQFHKLARRKDIEFKMVSK